MPKKYFALIFLISLLFPSKIFANITIDSYPAEIKIGQENTIEFSGTLEADKDYYFKVRIGKEGSLNKALTYNEETKNWLSDTSAWTSQSILKTNAEGVISAQLKFKSKDETELGENKLEISYLKLGDNTNKKEETEEKIILILEPDPTPTPTVIPSSTPTTIPTSSPSPSPTTSPKIDYNNISITEIFPNPETGSEWVEFFNNNDSQVNLKESYLLNKNGVKRYLDFTISSKSYYVFETSSLLTENDKITLFNSNNEEKATTESYNFPDKEKSWAKIGDNWCIANATKGSANTSCFEQISESDEVEEQEAKILSTPISSKNNDQQSETQKILNREIPKTSTNSATSTPEVKGISIENQIDQTPKPKIPPAALALSGIGSILILGSASPIIYPKIKPFLSKLKKKKEFK